MSAAWSPHVRRMVAAWSPHGRPWRTTPRSTTTRQKAVKNLYKRQGKIVKNLYKRHGSVQGARFAAFAAKWGNLAACGVVHHTGHAGAGGANCGHYCGKDPPTRDAPERARERRSRPENRTRRGRRRGTAAPSSPPPPKKWRPRPKAAAANADSGHGLKPGRQIGGKRGG